MIVTGAAVVENYLTDHAGHQGIAHQFEERHASEAGSMAQKYFLLRVQYPKL
jgi:hypothetical protein